MFKMTISGKTMSELHENLMEAACSMSEGQEMRQKEEVTPLTYDTTEEDEMLQEMYQVPVVPEPVVTDFRTDTPVEPEVEADEFQEENHAVNADVDSSGMPWDSRIHSATRALRADGTWRARRNTDPEKVKRIEATLIKQKPATIIRKPVVADIPPVPVAAVEVAPVPFTPPPVTQPEQAPVVAKSYDPIQVPTDSTKPAYSYDTFKAGFIPCISQLIGNKSIDQAYVESLKTHFGVSQLWDVLKNEKQLQEMFETFVSYGLITKVG